VPQFDQEKSLTDEGKYLLIQKLVNSIYHSYGDLTEVGQYLDDLLVGTQEPEQRTPRIPVFAHEIWKWRLARWKRMAGRDHVAS